MQAAEAYMQYALQLARKGKGYTSPNPMVGCVIVYKDKIIGQGWHQKAGTPHAEVHAIESVKEKQLLKEATLYVTLEPCNHYGRTPPCSVLIIQHRIPKVIIGCVDPNQKVAGSGIAALKAAGCSVKIGVLEQQCKALNIAFFTRQIKKRPLVILKWAESEDGYIAPTKAAREKGKVFWLTQDLARQKAHQFRTTVDAIVVGVQTIIDDNPLLNTRKWYGKSPQIAVIDPNHRIPKNSKAFQQNRKLLYFTKTKNKTLVEAKQVELPFKVPVREILSYFSNCEYNSILIEGGATTLQHFIEENSWDYAYKFVAAVALDNGLKAPQLSSPFMPIEKLGPDHLWFADNTDSKQR